ncbi:hypothetical protein CWB73_16820 [Pseudoalteromonas phenolica]|uniref:Uncharacterized protein n=1 Tax=Pseudoalteromonas phenolica TaxID=161398 RepID=A0A5S3YQ19_9GAMM|nr:hypothetical protein [Pseudoalteromonas phenolica]TMP78405.1 hypothetical protein CWB73_16820 [Pseudoalteromonas phenolica]
MPLMRWFCILLFSFLVTACGGGGTIDKDDGGGGGGSTDDYQLTLTILEQTSELSLETPLTIEATLKNDGAAVANTRVNFTTDVYARFDGTSSVLTDSNGKATVKLMPTNQQGAGAITASVSLSESTLEQSIDYSGMGDGGLRLLTEVVDIEGNLISADNPLSQSKTGLVRATLLFDGNPRAGETIDFQLDTLAFTNSNAKVETNSQGIAALAIQATKEVGAGEVIASYQEEQSIASFTTLGNPFFGEQIYAIALQGINAETGESLSNLSVATPITLQATLTLNGQALSNQTVEFTGDTTAELQKLSALTDANGLASTVLKANTVKGSGIVNVTFTSQSGTEVIQSFNYTSLGDGGIQMSITVLDSEGNAINESNPLSVAKPAIVTVKVVEDQIAKPGAIVEVNPGEQGNLDFTSRLTQSNGEAMFILRPNTNNGLGIISASYKGTSQIPSTEDLNVQDTYFSMGFSTDSIAIDISITDSSGNEITDANRIDEKKDAFVTISLSEGNTPLIDKFITVDVGLKGVTVPSDGRVVTDSNGRATLVLQANTETGAEALTATYTHNDNSDVVGVEPYYTDGNPKFDVDPYKFVFVAKNESDSNFSNQLSGTNPLILEAQLLLNNEPVANSRVQFSVDRFAILDHSSGSILTNTQGIATVRLLDNDLEGAGRATVTFEKDSGDLVATLDFSSDGTGGVTLELGSVLDSNGNEITESNAIGKNTNGFVTVNLSENNIPIRDAILLIQGDSLTTIQPSNGKVVTDINGQASFELIPTSESGLGEFTVTYRQTDNLSYEESGFVHSSGRQEDDTSKYDFDIKILTGCEDNWDENRNEAKLVPSDYDCIETNSLSSNDLVEVFIELSLKGSDETQNAEILNVTSTVGQILPTSGKALTDAFGIALLKLQPGNNGGAGTITASFKDESKSSNFSVGNVNLEITLDNGLDEGVTELKAGGSTVITATLTDKSTNELYTAPIDVSFSSICSANGESQLDAQVKSFDGEATATYRAKGCKITDRITATVEAGGSNFVNFIDLKVDESPAQALKFLTTNENFEPFIALPPGEGGAPTLSVVEFQLLDEDSRPIEQKRIDFRLTDSIGAANLTQTTSSTDNEGKAQTTVTSGIVPGPLVVQACYIPNELIDKANESGKQVTCWPEEFERCEADPLATDCPDGGYELVPISEQITGISSRILLSSGVTDQDSFDAAFVTKNINAWDHLGTTVDIRIYFGDQFNHLTGDGVTATVEANSGAVGTFDGEEFTPLYNCSSVDATCTLTWRRQGDVPFSDSDWDNQIDDVCDTYFGEPAPCIGSYPTSDGTELDTNGDEINNIVQGGRVNLLVVAKGQETFIDRPSSDGIERRNGRFDEGEFYLSFDKPEAFIDLNSDGKYNGDVLCSDNPSDDVCSPKKSDGGVFETFRDANNDGLYTDADGKYNGLLCSEAAQASGHCTKELIEVRRNLELVLSDDEPYVRFVVDKASVSLTTDTNNDGLADVISDNENCDNVTLPRLDNDGNVVPDQFDNIHILEPVVGPIVDHTNLCDVSQITLGDRGVEEITVYIYYSDINGNPLPAGTEIEITSENGKFEIDEYDPVVPEQIDRVTDFAKVTLKRENESNGQESGKLSIQFTFTEPDGTTKVSTKTITVLDSNP